MSIFKKIVVILVIILALEITSIYIGYKNNPVELIAVQTLSLLSSAKF